jgi:hypothetical protein
MTRVLQLPLLGEEFSTLRKNAREAHSGEAGRTPEIRTDAVYVVFTTVNDTLAAVKIANGFASALGVPVTILHLRTVPYAVPVDRPNGISPIETEDFLARLRSEGLNADVRVFLCRDERQALPFAVEPRSMIVMAGHRAWWPSRSERTRRMLEAAGHFVVFVDASEHRLNTGSANSPSRAA